MGFFFGVSILAFILAAISGAATSWDGSYLLFNLLQTRQPVLNHNEFLALPFHYLVIFLSNFTQDVVLLRFVFGLGYALIPISALLASWWLVKAKAPGLFVWAVLGIGLGTLPCQFFYTSGTTAALQLCWPILLGLLLPQTSRKANLGLLSLTVLALCSHPLISGLFAFLAGLAFLVGLRYPAQRLYKWKWAGLLAGLSIALTWVFNLQALLENWPANKIGQLVGNPALILPILALLGAWFGAGLILVAPWVGRVFGSFLKLIYLAELGSFLGVTGLLLVWVIDSRRWTGTLEFNNLLWLFSLPFVLMAVWEGLQPGVNPLERLRTTWQHRRRSIQVVGLLFALVFCGQSLVWFNLNQRLLETIRQSQTACVPDEAINWLQPTPLNHWSITFQALLLQGQTPQKLVLTGEDCADPLKSTAPAHNLWETGPSAASWYKLQPLQQKLSLEQSQPRGCWFIANSGWYELEQKSQDWWRWSNGQGQIRLRAPTALQVTLSGEAQAAQAPNRLNFVVNGQRQASQELNSKSFQPLGPVVLSLQPGDNMLELLSSNPAIKVEGDNRPLALALKNLSFKADESRFACQLQLP